MSSLVYKADFMDEITENYNKCVTASGEAINKLNKIKNELLSSYKGQGAEIAEETFLKIIEHMELLEECFSQTGKYVTYTKETVQGTDNAIADS